MHTIDDVNAGRIDDLITSRLNVFKDELEARRQIIAAWQARAETAEAALAARTAERDALQSKAAAYDLIVEAFNEANAAPRAEDETR